MDELRVAIDVGPLHGHRTGVALAVEQMVAALGARPDVELLPYIVSFRSRPRPGEQRLPLPAALAHRLWSYLRWPPADHWLGRPSVVHGTNYVVPPARAATVVSVYDCWFLAHPELAAPAVRRAGAVLRCSVADGAIVHASSHATARRVAELLATDRVEVVPLGPPPPPRAAEPRRPLAAVDGRPFVLSLGTMERRKNLPALVAAFGDAAGELPDVHLVLAGPPGDDAEAVSSATASMPQAVRQRVVLSGPVDDGQKAWLLANAAALAYPSLDEGFGFPLLEAQKAGTPVVATRAGSIAEVAGDGAELVDVGDRDALADALVRVVRDEPRRRALVAAGTANLTRFSWAATAEAMADLYRRAVERST